MSKNGDKDDPQAFCGAIKRDIEGSQEKKPVLRIKNRKTSNVRNASKFAQHDELRNMLAEELTKNEATNPDLAGDFQELLSAVGEGRELSDSQKTTLTDFVDELELPDDEFDRIASQAEQAGGFETGELGGSGDGGEADRVGTGGGEGRGGAAERRISAQNVGELLDFLQDQLNKSDDVERSSALSQLIDISIAGVAPDEREQADLQNILSEAADSGDLSDDESQQLADQAESLNDNPPADVRDRPGDGDEGGLIGDVGETMGQMVEDATNELSEEIGEDAMERLSPEDLSTMITERMPPVDAIMDATGMETDDEVEASVNTVVEQKVAEIAPTGEGTSDAPEPSEGDDNLSDERRSAVVRALGT